MTDTERVVLLTIVVSFGVAAALIGLAGLFPKYRPRAAELWPLYRSEVLIITALLMPAVLGGWYFAAALIAFVWRGQAEMFRLFDAPVWGPAPLLIAVTTSTLIIATTRQDFSLLVFALAPGAVLVTLVGLATNAERCVERALIGVAILFYPGLLAATIAALRSTADGFAWIFFAYATVEIADTFALLLGKLFGRVRVFPRLSPGKTAEGLIAGICGGGVAGALLAREMIGLSWANSVIAAAAILTAGLAGDLLTSAVKRRRKKKDFAPVLQLHGGVLDIYDSFLLAAPAALLLRPFLSA